MDRTRIVGPKSKSDPALVGDSKSVAQGRVDEIERGRAGFGIVVAGPSAHDVEAVAVQMEGMCFKHDRMCVLQNYLRQQSMPH